jgi:DNA-directed RNA polymerase subunit N (RpoN/RPB10)
MSAPAFCYFCYSRFSTKYKKYVDEMELLKDLPKEEQEKKEAALIRSLATNYCCRMLMKTIIRRPEQMVP